MIYSQKERHIKGISFECTMLHALRTCYICSVKKKKEKRKKERVHLGTQMFGTVEDHLPVYGSWHVEKCSTRGNENVEKR